MQWDEQGHSNILVYSIYQTSGFNLKACFLFKIQNNTSAILHSVLIWWDSNEQNPKKKYETEHVVNSSVMRRKVGQFVKAATVEAAAVSQERVESAEQERNGTW